MFWNKKKAPELSAPSGIGAADFAGAGTPLKFNSVDFRDGQQSLFATRLTTADMIPLLEQMDAVGYDSMEILRYYYGNNMYINTAEEVSGIPASWPRVDLTIGSTGEKVRQIQEELARISRSYPAIPTVTPDGIYGPATREAVEVFQRVFGLPVTGVIDYRTWYKISEIYVAVSRIAELV